MPSLLLLTPFRLVVLVLVAVCPLGPPTAAVLGLLSNSKFQNTENKTQRKRGDHNQHTHTYRKNSHLPTPARIHTQNGFLPIFFRVVRTSTGDRLLKWVCPPLLPRECTDRDPSSLHTGTHAFR